MDIFLTWFVYIIKDKETHNNIFIYSYKRKCILSWLQ